MGNWQLEVARMALYMSFPVVLFHYFNQPEYFENWVIDKRREIFPPENKVHREEIENAIRKVREQHDLQMLRAFEENK